MDTQPLFLMALTFILVHELDAVRCREWRIFPGLSSLKEPLAFGIFILAHIPIFFFLFQGLFLNDKPSKLIFWLDIFFILHFFLHLIFLRHKNNEFKDWISWTLISGAGFFGILDIFAA